MSVKAKLDNGYTPKKVGEDLEKVDRVLLPCN